MARSVKQKKWTSEMMPRTAYFDEHHVETLSERLRDL